MRHIRRALVLVAVVTSSFAAAAINAPSAHATIPPPSGGVAGYTVTSDGAPSLSGALGGGTPSVASNGIQCTTITLTRTNNFIIGTETLYQAHLRVCREWNMLAYGGVVYDVSYVMYVDHLEPTLTWAQGAVLYTGHYQNSCIWYWGIGKTLCGDHYGFRVDAATQIRQCLAYCFQTESVSAWMIVYDNGQWLGDLNHS